MYSTVSVYQCCPTWQLVCIVAVNAACDNNKINVYYYYYYYYRTADVVP